MFQAIVMPSIDEVSLMREGWDVVDDPEAGLGMASRRCEIPLMQSPSICFEKWLIEEGEPVGPQQVIANVLVNNLPFPIQSLGHGVVSGLVEWKEGQTVVPGEIFANVASRPDDGAKKTGLHPKPSSAMYFNRTGHFRVH